MAKRTLSGEGLLIWCQGEGSRRLRKKGEERRKGAAPYEARVCRPLGTASTPEAPSATGNRVLVTRCCLEFAEDACALGLCTIHASLQLPDSQRKLGIQLCSRRWHRAWLGAAM